MTTSQTRQTLTMTVPALNVYDAAVARMRELFDRFPRRIVCFSGGKDSTVVLQLALAEARRRQEPLTVLFGDEEAIDPDTEAYVTAVASWPDVQMHWCCAPVQHTFASHQRARWTCWDPVYESTWVRTPPPGALTSHPTWTPGMTMHELTRSLVHTTPAAEICALVGVRVAESFNRWRAFMNAGTYITDRGGYHYAKPVYDWKTTDVWTVIRREGWPYSHYYDRLHRLGIARHNQRIAPLGNVASVGRMAHWAQFYPDFWNRVLKRLPELDTMARYGTTRLYRKGQGKPGGWTWQEWTWHLLDDIAEADLRAKFKREIINALHRWQRLHSVPFPEEPVPTADGSFTHTHCWRQLARLVGKHDFIQGDVRDRQ